MSVSPWHRLGEVATGLAVATLVGLALGLAAVTSAVQTAATGSCAAPGAPSGAVAKNINTSLGCDVAEGRAANPATGFISLGMPAGVSAAAVVDALESLPTTSPQKFYQGSYAATFSSCTGGRMASASYTIGSGGSFPKTAPAHSATIAVIATSQGGTVSCAYALAYTPMGTGQPPSGVSVKNDVFVTFANGKTTQTASVSVKPFGPSPSPTPSSSPSPTPSASPSSSPSPSPSPSVSPSRSPSPSPSTSPSPTPSPSDRPRVLADTGGSPPIPLFWLGLALAALGCLIWSLRVRHALTS